MADNSNRTQLILAIATLTLMCVFVLGVVGGATFYLLKQRHPKRFRHRPIPLSILSPGERPASTSNDDISPFADTLPSGVKPISDTTAESLFGEARGDAGEGSTVLWDVDEDRSQSDLEDQRNGEGPRDNVSEYFRKFSKRHCRARADSDDDNDDW